VGIPHKFQKVKDHRELCRAARVHGAVVVLPHPYDHHELNKINFELIDCIEIFNSRSSPSNNKKAAELAKRLNKKVIYGSDAHMLKDNLNCPFVYSGNSPFEAIPEPLLLRLTSVLRKDASQLIKGVKQKDLRLLLKTLINLSKNMLTTKKR